MVSKTRAILLFTIKIVEIFELNASIPAVRSAEYQTTLSLKSLIIIHNLYLDLARAKILALVNKFII